MAICRDQRPINGKLKSVAGHSATADGAGEAEFAGCRGRTRRREHQSCGSNRIWGVPFYLAAGEGQPGDLVRLKGDLEFANDKPLLMHPELTVLGRVQAKAHAQPGQPLEVNQDFVLGSIEGDAEYLTQDSEYSTIRLTDAEGANTVLARILNPNRRQLPNPLNCRLRVRGGVESIGDANG